ncbi:MAG: cbb3-type cytochrome c oxidase subunit I, partial [Rhodocyclaceae bacterium]|nr:cbb3-type cytochrome c oxidase subunit I [Rhodocyclaceae bacterium]
MNPDLPIPDDVSRRLARGWLWIGIAALIGSGLLAVLLVLARTPGIQDVFPLRDFFRAALVVHVDLSVAIWFMAFAGVPWSLIGGARWAALARSGLVLAAIGTALLTLSPFFPGALPVLNNYIPVLDHPVFFAGLGIAGAGFALTIVRTLVCGLPGAATGSSLAWGIWLSSLAGAVAMVLFGAGWLQRPAWEGQALYEAVFWAGGHALQFQHTLLLAVGWFALAAALGHPPLRLPRTTALLFWLAALPVAAAPLVLLAGPPGSAGHVAGYARLMEWGHPLMLPLVAAAGLALYRVLGQSSPLKSAFLASFVLFAAGGVLAYMIRGANVVIPAHYHGSIVGVTLAFMGLTYLLLPRLGWAEPTGRLARWQPYVDGGGQLLHILGLAWSGGYGVQRKVAGAEQVLVSVPQKIGMGMMGLGGLIAIIGGL